MLKIESVKCTHHYGRGHRKKEKVEKVENRKNASRVFTEVRGVNLNGHCMNWYTMHCK